MKSSLLICFLLFLTLSFSSTAQQMDGEYGKGLTIKFKDSDSKYMRIIMWHQFWLSSDNINPGVNFSIRRSRVLAFTQFTPRFLVLTHFGLNSLGTANNGITANPNSQQSNSSDLFLHGAWGEFAVAKEKLHIGAGLHYWNGISRLTSQSTLNFMTLDNPGSGLADSRLFPWSTITSSDQFARHMGIYAKGTLGKVSYRVSANNARQNLGVLNEDVPSFQVQGNGKDWVYAGYFNVNLLENESIKLPYFVGTYLGKKKVLSLGAGFNYQPNALKTGGVIGSGEAEFYNSSEGVTRLAADVFYDAPMGANGGALNLLGAVYYTQYGKEDNFSAGGLIPSTGTISYAQAGYLLPVKNEKVKLMPYATYSLQNLNHTPNNSYELGLGLNWFVSGHNAKLTAEYNEGRRGDNGAIKNNRFRLQLHVFI